MKRLTSHAIPLDLPNGKQGPWEVSDVMVSADEARMNNLRCQIRGEFEYMVAPGTYKRLTRNGTVVMSNTPFEVVTNQPILAHAEGQVLINGFGLGMIVGELLKNEKVARITVYELDEDVVKLVGPAYGLTKYQHEGPMPLYTDPTGRLMVWIADAMTRRVAKDERWDAVWHDIWDTICADNLADMAKLKRKFAAKAKWQGCWCEDMCRRLKRRNGRY